MTIHLIRSAAFSREDFKAVYDLLTAVQATLQYLCDLDSIIDFSEEDLESRYFEHPEVY